MSKLSGLVTAILFVAGEPVEKTDVAAWCGIREDELENALRELEKDAADGAGLCVIRMESKVQLVTNPAYAKRLQDVFSPRTETTLSTALLETLTIIAYQQPVTRAEIEQVRGVRSAYPIATLVERGLVRKMGSKPVIGTPTLYGTTEDFLRQFGLESLADLPALKDPEEEQNAAPENPDSTAQSTDESYPQSEENAVQSPGSKQAAGGKESVGSFPDPADPKSYPHSTSEGSEDAADGKASSSARLEGNVDPDVHVPEEAGDLHSGDPREAATYPLPELRERPQSKVEGPSEEYGAHEPVLSEPNASEPVEELQIEELHMGEPNPGEPVEELQIEEWDVNDMGAVPKSVQD